MAGLTGCANCGEAASTLLRVEPRRRGEYEYYCERCVRATSFDRIVGTRGRIRCVGCPATFGSLRECEAHDCPSDRDRPLTRSGR